MTDNCTIGVLLLSVGRRGELTQIWKKTLLPHKNISLKIFATDLSPSLSSACQLSDQSFAVSRCTEPGYSSQILEICLSHGIQLVIPTIDSELQVLSESRKTFEAAGVHLIISDPDLVRLCRNKYLTDSLFKSLSILTPKILDPNCLTFPCFMKPSAGSCSHGIKSIPSADHLAPIDIINPANIFQELVPSDWIEYSLDLYYSKSGNLISCVARQRLEVRGGEISKGITRKDPVLDYLKTRMSSLKGARGVLTLQVFTNPKRDQILGIEINPRFGGGYPMSHLAGVDYPGLLIREYLFGESLIYDESWTPNLLMLRYDTMLTSSSLA